MGCNDLIFRKRLMNSSWFYRKKTLTDIKNYLVLHKKFNRFETDKDIASLKRDHLLLFGSDKKILEELEKESQILPLNQKTTHHELYAWITEAVDIFKNMSIPTVTSNFKDSQVNQKAKELQEAYESIESGTPKISTDWIACTIENGKKLGREFAASTTENASKFFEEVNSALEEEEKGNKLSNMYGGFRAFGFLPTDPLLFDPKSIIQEKELISHIYRALKLGELDDSEPEGEQISPGKQDFLDAIKLEKKESL